MGRIVLKFVQKAARGHQGRRGKAVSRKVRGSSVYKNLMSKVRRSCRSFVSPSVAPVPRSLGEPSYPPEGLLFRVAEPPKALMNFSPSTN